MASHIKPDPDAPMPYIKPDPDSKEAVGEIIDEDDIYEDAGDLDFSNAGQNLWLSRIPRSLWEYWSKLDDDEEIEIGTIRVEGGMNDLKRVSRIASLLDTPFLTTTLFFRLACASMNVTAPKISPRTTLYSARLLTPTLHPT